MKANLGDHSYVKALNRKFPKSMFQSKEDIDKLIAYTNAFLGAGGTITRINIMEVMTMCMNNEGKYGKYIIQESTLPAFLQTPEFRKEYHDMGRRRVLWLDDKAAPGGGFSMNSTWIVHADRDLQLAREAADEVGEMGKPHSHEGNEILGFLGSNPDDPSDLCGEVEIHIEGEKHILTKSTYIYLPAGVKHVPLYINRVDRPIFHFFITLTPSYVMVRDTDVFEV